MSANSNHKKNVVLYFGTFNPIHIGHLIIAQHVAESDGIAETWFVVSPKNPFKDKKTLLADHHRLYLCKIAIESNPKFRVSDIEFSLPKPSYTAFTLVSLREKYPDINFILLIGEDNLTTFHKWKNYEEILNQHQILVYPRGEKNKEEALVLPEILKKFESKIQLIDAPLLAISATYIRDKIKCNQSIQYLVSEPVAKYIDEMGFYKK